MEVSSNSNFKASKEMSEKKSQFSKKRASAVSILSALPRPSRASVLSGLSQNSANEKRLKADCFEDKEEKEEKEEKEGPLDSNSNLFSCHSDSREKLDKAQTAAPKSQDLIKKKQSGVGGESEIAIDITAARIKKFKRLGKSIIDSKISNVLLIILTLWALFADDIKLLTTTREVDVTFSSITITIQFIFACEIIISCLCVDHYINGFFFWLDLISVISMIVEIHWFYESLIEAISAEGTTKTSSTQTARVGAKAIRILRVVRLMRIVRFAKIYKISENFSNIKQKHENMIKDMNPNKFDNIIKEMNFNKVDDSLNDKLMVGKKLTDSTMRRVITLVLSMIVGIIIFDPNFYYSKISSIEFGIKMFNDFPNVNDLGLQMTIEQYIYSHQNSSNPILYLTVVDITYGDPNMTDFLRDDEKIQVYDDCSGFGPAMNLSQSSDILFINHDYSNTTRCFGVFDNRIESKLTAILNISKTVLVCLILFLGAFCFSKDTKSMVLEPLDSMVKKIKRISKNPAKAKQENEIEEYFTLLKDIERRNRVGCCHSEAGEKKNIETIILDKTIVKIGSLLAMGYGEAGSEIIEKNLKNNNGEINPMSPGENIVGVYAYFNFMYNSDVLDTLQHNYSIVLNEVLQIISEISIDKGVYNTKNVGDGILVVWKLDEKFFAVDEKGNLTLDNCNEVNQIIDCAIIFIIQLMIRVQTSKSISVFSNNLSDVIGENLNLSVGMHVGWAIEATAGSNFKIDISYLSPNINWARTLENLTKTYTVNLVLSSEIVNYMSDEARECTRPIDSVINAQGQAEKIYTIDLDLKCLEPNRETQIGNEDKVVDKLLKYENRDNKRKTYLKNLKLGNCWGKFFRFDREFEEVRKLYSSEFIEEFSGALELYVMGDWDTALTKFEQIQADITFYDPVNEFLRNHIKANNSKPPEDWNGGRKILLKK